ncbi:hypothetical protein DSO57_1008468 [Entomophthora muscae]|uniref:Uncharacterized protein n=1 Tax=Entomophthora muscae TaxID=34485 RepID=A0ACC2U5D0_9FUNG|nr:hypothetical protein DSO57_1008468 [Entomophthora muscae]
MKRAGVMALKKWWGDWATAVGLAAAAGLLTIVKPVERSFSLTDMRLSYGYKEKETIPEWLCLFLALFIPLGVQIVWLLPRGKLNALHLSVLGLSLSLTLTLFLASVAKVLFGRLRPDWLARCNADYNGKYPIDIPGKLATISICNPSRRREQVEGMKSFFSGHAAVSFAGLAFLALFLSHQLHLLQRPKAYKIPAVLLPLLLAIFIAATRLSDFRHHWEDVVVGSGIGCLTAIIAHRIYLPLIESDSTSDANILDECA